MYNDILISLSDSAVEIMNNTVICCDREDLIKGTTINNIFML